MRWDKSQTTFFFLLLFSAKEKKHFSNHLGPQKSKQVSKTSKVQNAYAVFWGDWFTYIDDYFQITFWERPWCFHQFTFIAGVRQSQEASNTIKGSWLGPVKSIKRCFPKRLGCGTWCIGQRPLGTSMCISIHQCTGVEGHSFSSGPLPNLPCRSSCPNGDRHCGGSIIC